MGYKTDTVVAQGSEAGGHRTTFDDSQDTSPFIETIALTPQAVRLCQYSSDCSR